MVAPGSEFLSVAIKHILPELAGDAKAWKRLRREAKTVARMNHPAVVQIYDIEEHDSGDWIVMELVDGETPGTLRDQRALLRQQTLSGRRLEPASQPF